MFYPYIVEGGLVWMLPIVLLSFFATAFALERGYYWVHLFYQSRNRQKILKQMFKKPFSSRDAVFIAEKSKDVVIQTLYQFLVHYQNMTLEIAERKAIQIAEEKIEESRQFLDWLSLIANISGTLGLLGTVVGISLSFKSMASEDAKGITLSLATALYTTVGGIILFFIAYLALFLFQKFTNQLDNALTNNLQTLKDTLEQQEKNNENKAKTANTSQPIQQLTEQPIFIPATIPSTHPIVEKKVRVDIPTHSRATP
ncbi:MAG TPA: MotA/TolQ/ExbB proton channel family protein [Planctomycetota bacterium]|nr:MotA/TolQ/ExbB proton channel family protein [Planctomycetota bacterium]